MEFTGKAGAHDENGAYPARQTGVRQRIPGKLRRKFMSVPGLRRIHGQPSQKPLSTPVTFDGAILTLVRSYTF